MRRLTLCLAVFLGGAWLSAAAARAEELLLAAQGRTDYRIVVADDASPSTRHGAEELQMFLARISGAKLDVVSDKTPPAEKEIVLGDNARLRSLGVAIDFPSLGDEGYVIRTVGSRLVIAGGSLRGNLYGVYGLLEDHLGCRWFAPGVSRIPKQPRLVLGPVDERKVPALEYREPYTADCFDGDWCARNRVNSSSGRLEAKHGGKVRFADGFFVHTFSRLVPPEKYFAKHPEYFSLVGGKRRDGYAQLCCTNEDVIRICTRGILEAMRAQPDAFVFSLSQNDTDLHCECAKCQALAKAEGSQMAPVLALVNRVADAAQKEFPGRAIETLAYQWTRHPPKTLRPRPNVIVRLCSIECCFSHPLATCDSPANRAFCADLHGWSQVSQRLWVWDYVTDFSHYLLPFPNQRVRRPNIRLFIANHVKGIFEQDTYDTPASEMASLGGYLTAKFLWNPDYDENQAIDEFLEGYYGKAAPPIRQYLDLLHDYAEKKDIHVVIWAPPQSPHLTDDLLAEADKLWEQAEGRVAGNAELLRRVKTSRLSVDYAICERARITAGQAPASSPTPPLVVRRFKPFLENLAVSGVTCLREGQPLNLSEYRANLAKALHLEP
jgi:hypothetical protein